MPRQLNNIRTSSIHHQVHSISHPQLRLPLQAPSQSRLQRRIQPAGPDFSGRLLLSNLSRRFNPSRTFLHTTPSLPNKKNMTDTNVEAAKRAAAHQAVADHFDPAATYVGIGSGTTIVYVVEAIKERSTNPNILFVPTGYQSRQLVVNAGLTAISFDSLPDHVMLDVAFDGADEVDSELNCIKGGGACLFQEKLVAERAKKFVCVADYRKRQDRLLTQWQTIPIEVAPLSQRKVAAALTMLGSTGPTLRTTLLEKSGPLKTDQDFFILDAPFPPLLTSADVAAGKGKGDGSDGTWEVNNISRAIKGLTGVLEVGIFAGLNGIEAQELREKHQSTKTVRGGQKPVAVYFGMADGSIKVRTIHGEQ
ncbi:ribose 5-phosphate isomerase [Decorospora gaudefroyi]|uniref:Ribose-5-phosphate isomerase n=1 Tax=Decorospora gaudefroyi TaxID=184978 RepID=A0A6A5KQI6_9PLEO|nr:ribose 5-phosphate isomerase [Decorospora gaudefroyi]